MDRAGHREGWTTTRAKSARKLGNCRFYHDKHEFEELQVRGSRHVVDIRPEEGAQSQYLTTEIASQYEFAKDCPDQHEEARTQAPEQSQGPSIAAIMDVRKHTVSHPSIRRIFRPANQRCAGVGRRHIVWAYELDGTTPYT
jgi:hypothetical protein